MGDEIKQTCSIGTLCHSNQILKNNNLKTCSYPFDWIFSNCDNVIHCLEDNFKIFLDKSYYVTISNKKCGHSYYSHNMWWHHNPLLNLDDYHYYIRCIIRFKKLLLCEERKLFVMTFVNREIFNEEEKNNIIKFNNKFSKFTKNYTLLVIFHIKNKESHQSIFTHQDNIDFLELHTLSDSNGLQFNNNNDEDYLNNIINKTYNFNIEIKPDI